ncbi:MAG: ADP-ribosylation factor-like protein [Promethearchaeota archaeon]
MFENKQKICFIGEGGVGKTSLVKLLQGKKISMTHSPTVGLEIEEYYLRDKKVSIWDLGGQERFKFMWDDFLRGAGLTVLVTDSTEENVEKTKEIYERYSRHLNSKIIAIANKQDLPGSLSATEVMKRLGGVPTYGMSAIKPELRDRIKQILEYELSNK